MISLVIGSEGEIALPEDLRERYGLAPETPVRVVETQSGILIIPLTDDPMTPALQRELAEWQATGLESWEQFPYESADE